MLKCQSEESGLGEIFSPNINESISKSCPAFIRLVAVVVVIHLGEKEVRGVKVTWSVVGGGDKIGNTTSIEQIP